MVHVSFNTLIPLYSI